MKFILFATLLVAASVTADYPNPGYACVQEANDPTWGPYCTQCYGYDTIQQFPICAPESSTPNCQLTFIPDGEFFSVCQLCEVGYSINVDTLKCDEVTAPQKVANCDLYWTPDQATTPSCLACSEGFVPNMKDPSTHLVECVVDAAKLQENCLWMQIDHEKVKHQDIYVPECLACKPNFVMYNDIKLVSLFKEKITSTCAPAVKHDDGCFVHNTVKNIIGSKIMDACVACDTRIGFFAIQPTGKFTPGRAICADTNGKKE